MDDREVDFLTRFVEESDAIEGIGNTPGNIVRQLDEEHNPRHTGHAGALLRMRYYASVRTPMSERMMKEVQQLITEEQHLKGAHQLPVEERGHWREHGVMMGERPGTHWMRVPEEMTAFITTIRAWQGERARIDHPAAKVKFIAWFHWMYERIHPFADGNGRSGRALVYYLYRYANLEPFVFTYEDRREKYYPCFNEFGSDLMEWYFLDRSLEGGLYGKRD